MLDDIIASELPYLARWLLDWHSPQEVRGTSRFGIKEFWEPTLLQTVLSFSRGFSTNELLDVWRKSYFSEDPSAAWEGTSTELLSMMQQDVSTEGLVRKLDARILGQRLQTLASRSGTGVLIKEGKRSNVWKILAVPPED